jgi:hypothetical protein
VEEDGQADCSDQLQDKNRRGNSCVVSGAEENGRVHNCENRLKAIEEKMACLERLQEGIDLLWQKARQLDDAVLKIMHELGNIKASGVSDGHHDCPIAKMRNGMNLMFGGKKGG